MQELLNHIAVQLSNHFNQLVRVKSYQQVFGGDINKAFHLETNIGSFFLKLNDCPFKDMFQKEFEGLQLLHQTQTIKIPAPILQGSFDDAVIPAKAGISLNNKEIYLVIEFIKKGKLANNFWQTFAHQLAALHKNTNTQFGLSTHNYIGSLPQQNNFCDTWSGFYATQRIMPLTELAFNQNKYSKADVVATENLCKRLYNFFTDEKPALIHGDLWSGNFLSNENGLSVIYDPAAYYGNREMDIAMSLLFGGFDKSFYDHYNEAFPLQPGWKERIKLCQLYPLMVHLVLFGGHIIRGLLRL